MNSIKTQFQKDKNNKTKQKQKQTHFIRLTAQGRKQEISREEAHRRRQRVDGRSSEHSFFFFFTFTRVDATFWDVLIRRVPRQRGSETPNQPSKSFLIKMSD